ncbi:sensor histidine kinase [Amycolatopsis sp. NPDC059027]|uniref:sensor histidine kinase n=1 Tax=unclassified Amycolatopsis TaxID=2618356 RepID=UPI00366E02F9
MRERTKRRWRVILDVLLWLALAFLVRADSWNNPVKWEFAGGLAAVTVAVVTARRYPVVSLGVAMCGVFVIPFDYGGRVPIWEIFLMVGMSYLAGLRMAGARPMLAAFGVVAAIGLPFSLVFGESGFSDWGAMMGALVFASVTPWLLGRYVRLRGELARTGWRRAEEMESRQKIIADQARLRERTRIASDMHDSLGHELTLLAVRAAALEVAGGLDETQRAAAAELRQNAATATERLREIIGVLREDAAPVEPVQGDLGELIDRARSSGMLIESRVDSAPDAPPMVRLAVYRVVQEALTNVAKHAPGAAVEVAVSHTSDATEVRVTNRARPAGPLPGASSGRRGLVGLRERVRLVGGTLRAGPKDGGFEVAAILPHDAAPAAASGEVAEAEESVSAKELMSARRDVRRSLIQAVVVPLGLFAVVLAVSGVVFLYQWYTSELPSASYAQLQVGQRREQVTPLLPARERVARPRSGWPVAPLNAQCVYYGTERTWLNANYAAYRLCFADDILVSKDMLSEDEPRGSRDPGGAG